MIPWLLNEEKVRVAVELGVDNGGFSKFNLMHCKLCEKYYMVDLWAPQASYVDGSMLGSIERSEARMREAMENVAPYANKAVIVRNSTMEAASLFKEASVDFIYIDARHDYVSVKQDLETWWPKIKPGGILSGHDYMDAKEVKDWRGPCPHTGHVQTSNSDYSVQPDGSIDWRAVKGAVDEFAKKVNRQIQVTYDDTSLAHFWFSYFIRK